MNSKNKQTEIKAFLSFILEQSKGPVYMFPVQ